jgi:PhnB protein
LGEGGAKHRMRAQKPVLLFFPRLYNFIFSSIVRLLFFSGEPTMTRPAHFPWVSPYIMASDLASAVAFYQKAFGFTLKEQQPEHAELYYKDQIIMLGQEGAYGSKSKSPKSSGIESPINLYIYVENVDEFHKNAVEFGAKAMGAPENMFWGDRMCRLQCPEGYLWAFALGIPCNSTKT